MLCVVPLLYSPSACSSDFLASPGSPPGCFPSALGATGMAQATRWGCSHAGSVPQPHRRAPHALFSNHPNQEKLGSTFPWALAPCVADSPGATRLTQVGCEHMVGSPWACQNTLHGLQLAFWFFLLPGAVGQEHPWYKPGAAPTAPDAPWRLAGQVPPPQKAQTGKVCLSRLGSSLVWCVRSGFNWVLGTGGGGKGYCCLAEGSQKWER